VLDGRSRFPHRFDAAVAKLLWPLDMVGHMMCSAERAMDEAAVNKIRCSQQVHRRENFQSPICSDVCGRRITVLSSPVIRFVVLFLLLASVVDTAAVAHRPAVLPPRGRPAAQTRYHNRRLIDGQLQTWQVARCRQRQHYVSCFLCGKVVQSQDIYYGCCRMHTMVLKFCHQLLA